MKRAQIPVPYWYRRLNPFTGLAGATLPDFNENVPFCIIRTMPKPFKYIEFRESSLDDLRAFPAATRREVGYQLDQAQAGREPDNWQPMAAIGRGVRETCIRDETGGFRIMDVARFAGAVYVLHCFKKRTQETGKPDLDVATRRYQELVKELES
jgi:phage-related protein